MNHFFKSPIYITKPLLPDREKYFELLNNIFDSGILSNNGKYLLELEGSLRSILDVPNLRLFNNGTTALLTAIRVLNLAGEVITTPFTFPATPHTLIWNGIKPVFCDIEETSMNIDVFEIEKYITNKTSAILAVHTFGTPCHVGKIERIAHDHNLKVIYDSAHAFMTKIVYESIGNFGDISMFSFHPTKLFHTSEGGALTYNNSSLDEKVQLLRNFGIKEEGIILESGINGKMNELQAAMGLIILDLVEEERKKRESISNLYKQILSQRNGIYFQQLHELVVPSYQYFPIRIKEKEFGKSRDFIYDELKKYNVFARKYFYPLCTEYSYYDGPKDFPVAKTVSNEVLCLPFYGELTESDVENICNIILG